MPWRDGARGRKPSILFWGSELPAAGSSCCAFGLYVPAGGFGMRSRKERCPCGKHLLDASSFERSEEHTSELQSLAYLVCRLLLEKKKKTYTLMYCILT